MIIYNKLGQLLRERNMQWKDLCNAGISVNMPAKFSHNRSMNTELIDKVCAFLQVQPGDIMEYIPESEYGMYLEKQKQNKKIAELEAQIAELEAKKKELQGK